MARGRMINITIAEDTEFNELSIEAQLVYLRTIPHLDRDGLVNGHPTVLWGKVAPLMHNLLDAMPAVIEELVNSGLVLRYSQAKTQILFFKGFNKNQALTHYDRESASSFAPPPGYYRTNKGLKPIELDDGLAPDEPQKTPPSTNGLTPDKLRTNSGLTPDEVPPNRIEVKEKGREENARETELREEPQTQQQQPPPPFASKQQTTTGDPLMDIALNRSKQKEADDHRKARRVGAWPELDQKVVAAVRLPLVERLIDMHGLRAAIDVAEDDDRLADMHKLAADLYVMGFTTVADIETVYAQFKKEWRDKTPAGRQLFTTASAMRQAKVTSIAAQSAIKPFKQWMLDTYNCDKPQFVAHVEEAVIRAQYERYRAQNQQPH